MRCLGGCILGGMADLVAQKIEERPKFDLDRTTRFAAWRTFFHTPLIHVFFGQIERYITEKGAIGVAKKIAVNLNSSLFPQNSNL